MNEDHEAELRRRLTTSVPKPPDGLLERIQADIPQYLEPRRSTSRIPLSIAASILVLIGAAWFAARFMTRPSMPAAAPMIAQAAKKNETRAPMPARMSPPAAAVAPPVTTEAPKPVLQIAEAKPRKQSVRNEPAGVEGGISGGVVGGVVGGVIGGVPSPAPPPSPPVPEEAPVTAAAPAPAAAAAKTANTDILARSAVADEVALTPSTLFGVATNSRRLDARNAASTVQHFAAPATRPKHDLRVEAEAAPQPIDATHEVLRISIDAPAGENAPVASDAKLEVDFDPNAVVSHRAIVGDASAAERVIVTNASATLLFDIELAPDLARRQKIATVRLTWRSVANGKEQTIERVIRSRDVMQSWEAASNRTKRASLAAALAEAVRKGEPTDEIARKAREAGFDELADLASR